LTVCVRLKEEEEEEENFVRIVTITLYNIRTQGKDDPSRSKQNFKE